MGVCLHLLTLLSCAGFILRWAKTVPCSPRLPSHQPSGNFLLFNNSHKSPGVEAQVLSLGQMTITEAMAMISLGHVHDSVPRAWGGARKNESFGSEGRRCWLHQRSLGTETRLPRRSSSTASGEASEFQSLALLARDIMMILISSDLEKGSNKIFLTVLRN